ncbi:MAG: serine hydrolase [Candidatus Bathyarchaeia archaeon]
MTDEIVSKMREFIEKIIPNLMEKGRIPGLSIAVVREGEVIYANGFGAKDFERNLPATSDTLYGTGSVTKSFVALAIMQLLKQGKLSLDDPARKYIPLKIGRPGKQITIKHLLTHSSGIPSLGTSTIALQRGMGLEVWVPWGGVDDFYRHLNDAGYEIAADPSERFFYLNAGYRMLGHIIQKVSGTRFDGYITKNILKPLGMERTTLSKAEYMKDPDRMTPYRRDKDGKPIPTEFPYPNVADNPQFAFIAAAGGVISSVRELTKYLSMNIDMGTYEGEELVSKELIEEMQRPHIERSRNLYGSYWYGFGWGITENFLGAKMVSHGGSILVSTAHLAFVPEQKIGVAMASNIAGFPHAAIAQGALAALMGYNPEEVVPTIKIWKRMEILTGRYETYKGLAKAEVVNRGGRLYIIQKGHVSDITVPLIPEEDMLDENRFYIWTEGVRQPVEFVVKSKDRIDLYIERNRYHKVV